MALVTSQQFKNPSILDDIRKGVVTRGEAQRQQFLTQDQENKFRLQKIAEDKFARDLATQQRALGVSTDPEVDASGQISESAEVAQRRMIAENPDVAKKILADLEVHTQQGLEEMAKFTHTIRGKNQKEQILLTNERIKRIEDRGGDATQTKRLLITNTEGEPIKVVVNDKGEAEKDASGNVIEDESGSFVMSIRGKQLDSAMVNANESALTALQRAQIERDKLLASARLKKDKANITRSRNIVQSAEILPDGSAVLVMKDGTTKVETLKDTAKRQVKTARTYGAEIQGLRSGERESGKGAIKIGHDAFNKLAPIRKNITNLRKGITLLDKGALTGPLDKFLPNFRASTIELKNLQGQLGLDIISDVTFGALSEAELAFALDTAIPERLNKEELKSWLLRKASGQSKLYDAYEDAALYLGKPGNDIPGYLQLKRAEREEQSKVSGDLTEEETLELQELQKRFK